MSEILNSNNNTQNTDVKCFHCGTPCNEIDIVVEEKHFCCNGCQLVYEILNQNDLCNYYDLESNPGYSLKGKRKNQYAYLDNENIKDQLIDFENDDIIKISFPLPSIHCSSCIWLLENLYKLNTGIQQSRINFTKKEGYFILDKKTISLRELVEILDSIGYPPAINFGSLDEKEQPQKLSKTFSYQIAIAGFAFGNIMMLSFPEYLGLEKGNFKQIFSYIMVVLSLPVIFYSAKDYFLSAWTGIKEKYLNIDFPISLGIITLFLRSLFEIFFLQEAGYLDSLAGLVFFLLIGKWFQQKTYHQLSFDRDYKSYFPIATNVIRDEKEIPTPLNKLVVGNLIIVKHQELIPADGILTKGKALVDYSFVTGEADPIEKNIGDKIFAGGRQLGKNIELTVNKNVTNSYLTQLWNNDSFKDSDSQLSKFADKVGRIFTGFILSVAILSLFYWVPKDLSIAINVFTSVLIIACPCAVALTIPFTYGNIVRLFGLNQFYLKNTNVIEDMQEIDHIIFDKTGTITDTSNTQISFNGKMTKIQKNMVLSITNQSTHPKSREISLYLNEFEILEIDKVEEIVGLGITGKIGNHNIKIGSAKFLDQRHSDNKGVFVAINDEILGVFTFQHQYRKDFITIVEQLKKKYTLSILSGDNDSEKQYLEQYFDHLLFNQSPQDKLDYVQNLQENGKKVMMIGDGLNDAGALQKSDAGIVITENINNFTPACKGIISANKFGKIPDYLTFSNKSVNLIIAAYILAAIYNIIGLSFAVQGLLSPVVAAILMPLSSITIAAFGVFSSNIVGKRYL